VHCCFCTHLTLIAGAAAVRPPDFAKSQGQSLGASSSSSAATAASFSAATPRRFVVDAAQPTTNLQLVLADRRKIKETANQAATVLDLYQHIMSSVEAPCTCSKRACSCRFLCSLFSCRLSPLSLSSSLTGLAGFELVAGFPPKPLADPSQTLKEAGLLNGSITQRGGS
jgi:hypothetical protein